MATVFRQARADEIAAVLDLCEVGFAHPVKARNAPAGRDESSGRWHRAIFSYLYGRGDYLSEWLRVAEHDGQLVSYVGIVPRVCWLWGEPISLASLTPVVTHPDYRRRGMASGCMRDALKYLETHRIAIAQLYGHSWYYGRFDMVEAMPWYETQLPACKAAGARRSARVRRFGKDDLSGVRACYDRHAPKKMTLAQVRSADSWWQFHLPGDERRSHLRDEPTTPMTDEVLVATADEPQTARSGRPARKDRQSIVGYVVWRRTERHLAVVEGFCDDAVVASSLLAALSDRAGDRQDIVLQLPPAQSLPRAALKLGGEHRVRPPQGTFVRVTYLPALKKWFARVVGSRLKAAGRNRDLTLKTELGTLALACEVQAGGPWKIKARYDRPSGSPHGAAPARGGRAYGRAATRRRAVSVELPQKALTELILGTRPAEDIANDHNVLLTSGARKLLAIAFPVGYPYLLEADRLF